MASADYGAEEKRAESIVPNSDKSDDGVNQFEKKAEQTAHDAADDGHAATDRYGAALVHIDPIAERKLTRKIDFYVVPTVALLYLFCFIDRANIGNARLNNLERDLGLKGDDYNKILSIFYISYILFEIPSNMACKWIGPGWYLPAISLGFGIISVCTAFVHNIHQISGVRFLLGVFEAGMLPGIAYYMSRWYTRRELAFRLSLYVGAQGFLHMSIAKVEIDHPSSSSILNKKLRANILQVVMAPLAGAFGGLLASGIFKLPHFGGLHTWRMLFAIEGIITTGLAVISFFTLTDRPATAKWLSQAEKEMAVARLKIERVGTTEVLDKFDKAKTLKGIFSPVTLATSFIFLLDNITVQGLAFFTPTIVRTIYPRETVVQQQLHTVPPYIVGGFFTLLFPFLSSKMDKRNIFLIVSAPLMIIGYIMFLASDAPMTRYGATCKLDCSFTSIPYFPLHYIPVILRASLKHISSFTNPQTNTPKVLIASGAYSFGAICNAQVSANVVSDTARSSAIGTVVMFGNIGGLISTWSFLPNDGPNYPIGNGLNLATSCTVLLTAIALLFWMKMDNRKREKRDVDSELAGLTPAQIQDLDYHHPAFRWKP
ncbi:hypothetical protein HYFRA_00005675 [Hymenoscyphus fraxineus]|uniref:Major facilitator superfamily (MFS) profile domain-containing protein n=1 Tax=Hymenoscyphus fraxineus TaxID=746836 RepID=A0A9N9KRN9_9HELO|nr:hypothetical protein HYFRA_00005675 [Hymenoscyphus fraxineus]